MVDTELMDAGVSAAATVTDIDIQTLESYARVCDQRASTYSLLARLYKREVDQEFLDLLRKVRFPMASGNEDVDEGYRMIATYLSRPQDDVLLSLAVDYARSFLGSGNNGYCAAYPFESVYTSEKRLLMQEARDEVLAIYRSAGLEKRKEWREGEDHIALELEYLNVLAGRAAERFRSGEVDAALAALNKAIENLKPAAAPGKPGDPSNPDTSDKVPVELLMLLSLAALLSLAVLTPNRRKFLR